MLGYQHTAVNTTFTALLCAGLWEVGRPITAQAIGAGLLFGTLLVTPDLDLPRNDARRRWGTWRFIWGPYAALSTHRGLSHTYLFGPISRLLYLSLWLAPLILSLRHWAGLELRQFSTELPRLEIFLIGYLLSQWLHLLCDGIYPFAQRRSGTFTRHT